MDKALEEKAKYTVGQLIVSRNSQYIYQIESIMSVRGRICYVAAGTEGLRIMEDFVEREATMEDMTLLTRIYPKPDSNKASEKQVGGGHYKNLKIQPMEYCLQNNLNYAQSNAIKYITRYKDKNGIEDLKKATHCIELLIEFEEKVDKE